MQVKRLILIVLGFLLTVGSVSAREPQGVRRKSPQQVQSRAVCANSESGIDQAINNVRARLLGGGDCWWDLSDGRYIVPKVDAASGQREVSALYAASVWLGGFDQSGSLKLACLDYRTAGQEFWPGPLNPNTGKVEELTCKNWDRHFRVTSDEIRQHLSNIKSGNIDPNAIPKGVKGWPSKGNPYFTDVWQFSLPNTPQGLAGFYDAEPVNGLYNPLEGDYPSIEIRGCDADRYPDEMIFWIYNDEGNGATHANSQGKAIQMEVQVQAFSYLTADALNDMTFQRYKLINRASDLIDSTFFAMWVDPDLGCFRDDYVGCDTTNSLMYCYNQDALDGDPGCSCPTTSGDVPTYCEKIPIIGVDYFRGPRKPVTYYDSLEMVFKDDSLVEIGMSSFIYYNSGTGGSTAGTRDPGAPNEFYNYLTGRWRDGTPLTIGGTGYNQGTVETKYAFPSSPNDPTGWSMCTAALTYDDRRTLQASGPFRLKPGAQNELIIGVPFVAESSVCPDIEQLLRADKLAQGLFDNCFERLSGPDAPTVGWVELNQQLVAVLSNDGVSNNLNELYIQKDFLAPDSIKNSPDPAVQASALYKFEGYIVYQLQNPNVTFANFDDPTQSRLVAQVDRQNGISRIVNWTEEVNPADEKQIIYIPTVEVEGANKGIRHTFSFTSDAFATGNDKRLLNHRKYYYAVLAYAHNEYEKFDPFKRPLVGQQNPFLPGGRVQTYTVIPRPIVDQALNAAYGQGVEITRLQGTGVGGNFVDLQDASREAALDPNFNGELSYKAGRGPLNVTIFNPFEVADGEYEIAFVDNNNADTLLQDTARWELRSLSAPGNPVIASAETIAELNEQVVSEYGFSVTIQQTAETGNYSRALLDPTLRNPGETNGAIGAEIGYEDVDNPWLLGYPDQDPPNFFHFVKTRALERDESVDPKQGLSKIGNGFFVPYALCDWELPVGPLNGLDARMITPAWTGRLAGSVYLNGQVLNPPANPGYRTSLMNSLPNVDIVLTTDKSKWSRCVVIETASEYYTANMTGVTRDPLLVTESPSGRARQMFDVRFSPSVGKDDSNGDGLPDPDGATETSDSIYDINTGKKVFNARKGQPINGMGWFPGYAIDVETGERLNIFFGENSAYSKALNPNYTGRDMMWNPTSQVQRSPNQFTEVFDLILGGQHWVYVTRTPYDECESLRYALTPEFHSSANSIQTRKRGVIPRLTWCGMLQMATGYQAKSLRDGLIPNDATVKIRVENPYQNSAVKGSTFRNLHPKYRFKINGLQAQPLSEFQVGSALDSIKVVPNPYYAFSAYETSPLSNIVKITNLPAKCVITIYSLDGKFIRQYKRNEVYSAYNQITPAVEWDIKNSKGIPVASGVYLIHISAEGIGERTVKWFGIQRQFDPSGL